MSRFDKDAFLAQEVHGALETAYTPPPKGDWSAFIKDIEYREANDTPICRVVWSITDERVKEAMAVDEVLVNQDIWLDVEEGGALAFGANKNVRLGKLRDVLGQNDPNKPWNFRMLVGCGPCLISIDHRDDKKDKEIKYGDVVKVAAISS